MCCSVLFVLCQMEWRLYCILNCWRSGSLSLNRALRHCLPAMALWECNAVMEACANRKIASNVCVCVCVYVCVCVCVCVSTRSTVIYVHLLCYTAVTERTLPTFLC